MQTEPTLYKIGCTAAWLLNRRITVYSAHPALVNPYVRGPWNVLVQPDGTVFVTAEFFISLAMDHFRVRTGQLPYLGRLYDKKADWFLPVTLYAPGTGFVYAPLQRGPKPPTQKRRRVQQKKKMFH